MEIRTFLLLLFALSIGLVQAQVYTNVLLVPDTINSDFISLDIQEGVTEFNPGTPIATRGYNQSYLGPTLIFDQYDNISVTAVNNLTDVTTVHWHGMEIPQSEDGGPHTKIFENEVWEPSFEVRERASTLWYHSHLHSKSREQVNAGLGGMIIVRDTAAINDALPHRYGVDDFPIILQDKTFTTDGNINHDAVLGEEFLVNGTLWPVTTMPNQQVRFRLLNASIKRFYNIGLSNNSNFKIIATEGGLLENAIDANRIVVSPGERYEIVVDFGALTPGDSLFLMNFGTEIPYMYAGGIPGNDTYPSPISNVDTGMLKINIGPATMNPIVSIPTSLGVVYDVPSMLNVTRNRYKRLTGKADPVNGGIVYTINDREFSLGRVNDTVIANATEIWEIHNLTHFAHPFHIHAGHFYILDRDSVAPSTLEMGAKDVVIVHPNERVRFIMAFPEFIDTTVGYMYHCHMLDHEDRSMMGQFLITDSAYFTTGIQDYRKAISVQMYPNPVKGMMEIELEENVAVSAVTIIAISGEEVLRKEVEINNNKVQLNLNELASGQYVMQLYNKEEWLGNWKFMVSQ